MRRLFLSASILTLLLFGLSQQANATETPLSEVMILDGYFEIKVPTAFTILKESEIKKMYPENGIPISGYANVERTIRLAFYTKQNSKVEYQFQGERNQYLKDWKVADPKLKEISNGGKLVDGRDMGYLAVMHKLPEPAYHFIFMCDYKGMLFVGELVCPKKLSEEWMATGIKIMDSVKKV